ncbi:MLP3.9 protein [Quillaja saponaria]|uniref:MLP3.9 protein n=1 Tax=Quillaja saponaria TaxID=32244 RepID=A0AAD7PRB8_QUISA|nr:MLP3.9 protein [Quillaja saponaria]
MGLNLAKLGKFMKERKENAMKVAPKVVFLIRDTEGFASAISDAFLPNSSTSLRRLEDSFELSLEGYGIRDHKASGNIVHYVDDKGCYQVSVLLLQNYEPPVLACAINEVLAKIMGDKASSTPTLLAPFVLASSKLKWGSKSLSTNDRKVSVYGIQSGKETDITHGLITITEKPPSSLQIHHESLACFLHFVRVLKFPTYVLIGQRGQRSSDKSHEELEILYEIGKILADATSLQFITERITWNPTMTSRENEKPWRALYG